MYVIKFGNRVYRVEGYTQALDVIKNVMRYRVKNFVPRLYFIKRKGVMLFTDGKSVPQLIPFFDFIEIKAANHGQKITKQIRIHLLILLTSGGKVVSVISFRTRLK